MSAFDDWWDSFWGRRAHDDRTDFAKAVAHEAWCAGQAQVSDEEG